MLLTHCTLTGVDESTPLSAVAALSAQFPIAEWGFLYSPTRQGCGGRYPAVGFIRDAFESLPPNVRVALHVCGQGVPDLLYGADRGIVELVDLLKARSGRVQLNFNISAGLVTFTAIGSFLAKNPSLMVITQHNKANAEVWKALEYHKNHRVLFDASGGRGISPTGWPEPLPGVSCGYAGGLGPDNLEAQLEAIATVAGDQSVWADMEGKLRTDQDTLDLGRAEECLTIATVAAAGAEAVATTTSA